MYIVVFTDKIKRDLSFVLKYSSKAKNFLMGTGEGMKQAWQNVDNCCVCGGFLYISLWFCACLKFL